MTTQTIWRDHNPHNQYQPHPPTSFPPSPSPDVAVVESVAVDTPTRGTQCYGHFAGEQWGDGDGGDGGDDGNGVAVVMVVMGVMMAMGWLW